MKVVRGLFPFFSLLGLLSIQKVQKAFFGFFAPSSFQISIVIKNKKKCSASLQSFEKVKKKVREKGLEQKL
jgi:hypothetical protein